MIVYNFEYSRFKMVEQRYRRLLELRYIIERLRVSIFFVNLYRSQNAINVYI